MRKEGDKEEGLSHYSKIINKRKNCGRDMREREKERKIREGRNRRMKRQSKKKIKRRVEKRRN